MTFPLCFPWIRNYRDSGTRSQRPKKIKGKYETNFEFPEGSGRGLTKNPSGGREMNMFGTAEHS